MRGRKGQKGVKITEINKCEASSHKIVKTSRKYDFTHSVLTRLVKKVL